MFLEKFKLVGKTALITGGGRGIGLACGRALAEAGANVVLADSDPSVGASGKAELADHGLNVDVIEMDVTRSEQVEAIAGQLARDRGVSTFLLTMLESRAVTRQPRRPRTSIG